MSRLARICTARPKAILALWALAGVTLFAVGQNGADSLKGSDILIDGTRSSKAVALERSHFGDSQNLVVLLKGSPKSIGRYGPRAAKRLDRIADVSVLSPWSPNAPGYLRPRKGQALLVLQIRQPLDVVGKKTAPVVRKELAEVLPKSVTPHVTGIAELAAEMNRVGYKASKRSELLAIPILLIVLLLVFRSPIAALLPALLGISVIVTGGGIVALLSQLTPMDAMATAMMSMMGLALGTDYSLLVVSRFREEVAAGHDVQTAVERTARTAGRTVVFSGTVLIFGMVAALVIAPGGMMTSATVGSLGAAVLAMAGSATLLPALLALVGPALDRYRIGRKAPKTQVSDVIKRLIKRPGIATAAVLLPLIALTVPASTLGIGALSPAALPAGNTVRQDFEEIGKAAGGGWIAIFNVVAVSDTGPMTDSRRLAKLDRFQSRLAKQKGVDTVLGPAALNERSRELRTASTAQRRSLARVEHVAAGAKGDVDKLTGSLAEASSGAQGLNQGLGQSFAGTSKLESALSSSASGSQKLGQAIAAAKEGSTSIASASSRVEAGSAVIRDASSDFSGDLRGSQASLDSLRSASADATENLRQGLATLDRASAATKSDPEFAKSYKLFATALGTLTGEDPRSGERVQTGYSGFENSIARASAQNLIASKAAGRMDAYVSKLERGVGGLRKGARSLAGGLDRIYAGSGSLTGGLDRTRAGAGALGEGNKALQDGSGTLAQGLDSGLTESGGLKHGLDQMAGDLQKQKAGSGAGASGLPQGMPTKSGYFLLAGIDSGKGSVRQDAAFALNVDRGGTASRVMIVPDWANPDKGRFDAGPEVVGSLNRLDGGLNRMAAKLGDDLGAQTAVGGRGAVLTDYVSTVKGRILPLLLTLISVALVVLTIVFRSPLLALKAVILNLLTVGAAFGAFVLVTSGDSPILGGAGYLEPFSVYGVLAIMFALSIDYEVFLITRMREGYEKTGSTEGAIAHGIDHTARVITGAAAIMIGVFFVFSVSDYMIVRQLGFALGVAVFLDATVVRLVLLPAAMKLFGRANWWMPAWLERLIPEISVEGKT